MTISTTTVKSSIIYFVDPPNGERAFQSINANPNTGGRNKNFIGEPKDALIENVRGQEANITLDKVGFQLFHRPSKHTAFTNDADIEKEYYPESTKIIKELTGASKVVLFDHTVRRHRPGVLDDHPNKRQPVAQAHVDQSNKAAVDRVHRHLPSEEVPSLLKRRFQIINLWRPISHPALDHPLALCDYRSVDPMKDVAPVALVYPDKEGETLGVRYNPAHKWKYFRGVTPEEMILIKCYDSVQDGSVAVFTPHTGFKDPSTPEDAPLRESIEVRALVFYD